VERSGTRVNCSDSLGFIKYGAMLKNVEALPSDSESKLLNQQSGTDGHASDAGQLARVYGRATYK